MTDGVGTLRDERYDVRAEPRVFGSVSCQFNEPAAAVRSPRSAMEGQEDASLAQVLVERTEASFLVRQRECGRDEEGGRSGHSGVLFRRV